MPKYSKREKAPPKEPSLKKPFTNRVFWLFLKSLPRNKTSCQETYVKEVFQFENKSLPCPLDALNESTYKDSPP
jgi:hypothetical protein